MKTTGILIVIFAVILSGIALAGRMENSTTKPMRDASPNTEAAVFAGGCFWCTESDFEKVEGVVEAVSGYTGGRVANPSYRQVSAGGTGHVEAVKVIYEPSRISYAKLLEVFWRHVDPTDPGGQFVDRGSQYRSVIFYANDRERRQAEASKKALAATDRFDRPIATEILPLGPFYPAEDYHQNYYKKNPIRYHWYRSGSGRDQFLKKAWADLKPAAENAMAPAMEKDMTADMKDGMDTEKMSPGTVKAETPERMYSVSDDAELRRRLTPMQYKVARQNGTEPAFRNEYWNNHAAGIYVDIVSGEPLFSSKDKFESGTGWPSFTRPLEPDNVVEKTDRSFFMVRTEVRSRHGDSHLGHVFADGPAPTGLRYCINSAALRFVPAADLEQEGYGQYRELFR